MNLKALFEQHSHSTYIESEEGFHRVMLAKDFARAAAEIRRQEQQDTVARIVKSLDATANDLLGRQASASLAEQYDLAREYGELAATYLAAAGIVGALAQSEQEKSC